MAIVKGVVKEVLRRGADAVTLRMEMDRFAYRPGQYVKVDPYQFSALRPRLQERELKQGRRVWPAYFSLSSDATDPRMAEFTPRVGRDGRESLVASHLVASAAAGMELSLEGPGGRYCLPEEAPAGIESFLHVCAGSGVAPNRGMIRHALARGWPQRHLLLLQERQAEDVLFHEEWAELAARPGFRFRPLFSRSRGERISAELLREAAAGFLSSETTLAFVCGPNDPRSGGPGFCDLASSCVATLGIPPDRILRERG
jgi:ferredoxin-NADP reductase